MGNEGAQSYGVSQTAQVKYVFMDIVGFTHERSVEAQSDLVANLNRIVRDALVNIDAPQESIILIPTGDGIAVALVGVQTFDIHLMLALELLRLVAEHNAATKHPMRQFQVRLGINENVDNLVLDINERKNVAGSGISMAQRIMDKADGGQILLGQTVYETLHPREKYMKCFRAFQARGKHGVSFPVYQFGAKGCPGLDTTVPTAFSPRQAEDPKFTRLVAYYAAHAAANRDFLLSRKEDPSFNFDAILLLHFLAQDSLEKALTPSHDTPVLVTWGSGSASFEEQYYHYDAAEFWVVARFAEMLCESSLAPYAQYFEASPLPHGCVFVKAAGLQKMREDHPGIAAEFGLSEQSD